ncbi:SH3 domain and tetratricopeptide repeat-containing protein 1 isoform X2 [Toxotes jaculatrix]|uniref:SH3 domain and tetratricopeptide repeat-containing protein 1 isoform X2 n=1 Tax=Toxotes jaculatrix TaxID=941984 RepID=UPI001B3AC67A|nr:SH3 domain and tetratricopeptide repeat-containing protein 1 isoform X2 [Toxotes jaculatrix]
MDVVSLKGTLSTCEESFPTALAVSLDMVRGPERLPADEELKEMLRRKLRILQVDSTEVNALFTELCAHVISINSEDKVIFVRFKTFEELWKFTTYYTIGFLGQCMESLLLDQEFWLSSLEEKVAVEVSIQEETLHLIYKGILMQEGSFFASCSANQMFDSSTSGGDLYLEQGDIAQFEPPFLGSGWTVLCLADGARGTAPKPALEPVIPFHQLFLKSCAESVLVGGGKPACDFPLQFARGTCLAMMEYDAEGPDELSVAPGDHIIIVGLLVSCFDWFTGRKEATGEVGLVKTSLVKPLADVYDSADILLEEEEGMFFSLREDKVIEETAALIKKKSQNDTGRNYKLDIITYQDSEKKPSFSSPSKADSQQPDLKKNIQRILDQGKDSSPVTTNGTLEDSVLPLEQKDPTPPCFTVHPVVEGNNNTENFIPLFSFLEGQDCKEEFGVLYGLSSELLSSTTFSGHSDEDQLIAFLSVARETARKKQLFWSQTRLCFLLGKLCAGRSKFSQARVYFEEALCVPREGFRDLKLLANIYSNLAAIYLLQKNTESFFAVAERLVALILGIPDCLESLEDNSVLKYLLKKAVLAHNKMAEARACYLLAKHHWICAERAQAATYLERLLILCAKAQRTWSVSLSHGYLALGKLYSELCLPHLSVSSARRVSLQPSARLSDCLNSMVLVLVNVNKLYGIKEQEASILPQAAPFLRQALSFIKVQGGVRNQCHVLSHQLTVCLSQLFYKHKMVGHAIHQMHTLINNTPPLQQVPISVPERNSALIWLAWLHIDNNQPSVALDILDSVLSSMPEHCTTPQEGVVLNMRGVALRCMGDLQRAAESYQAAVAICQEYEDLPNWAVAQANLGLLCLKAGAKGLAQRHLTEAVQLFSELDEEGHEANFITVLLELGQHYLKQQQLHYGKGCYEWALLLAINADLLDCQLTATRNLCHLYGCQSPDQAQCIIYSQHQVQLLRRTGDKGQEGDALEAISQLYLTLGTERAYRAALDYTKSSLGIFIDLGCREKEAYGWLQAGKIYHLLGQTELVDLYVQV